METPNATSSAPFEACRERLRLTRCTQCGSIGVCQHWKRLLEFFNPKPHRRRSGDVRFKGGERPPTRSAPKMTSEAIE